MKPHLQKPKVSVFCVVLFLFATVAAQQLRPVNPSQGPAQPNHFYSPAVDAGDYIYISGQGPLRPDGSLPASFREQVHQALANVKAIVDAAGLKLDNVVYTQVYMQNVGNYDEMNRAFREYFPDTPPARAVLGVARVPASAHRDQRSRGQRSDQPTRHLSAEVQERRGFSGNSYARPIIHL